MKNLSKGFFKILQYPIFDSKKEKDNQSLVVLIENSVDSVKERFGLQLASGRSEKLLH